MEALKEDVLNLKKTPCTTTTNKIQKHKNTKSSCLGVLEAIKEDILNLEFHEPDRVDEEDKVLDEVTRERDDDKGPPSIRVRERAFKVNITMKDN